MPRVAYWGLFELVGSAFTIPPLPTSASPPALPPSLVLRLLIPHRAEAAVFCLLLLPVEHRHHLPPRGGAGRAGQELAGLVQMVADVKGWFWVFVGSGTLLWPPPCSASSGLPPLPSAHTLLRCSAQKFRCTSPKARWPPPMSQQPPAPMSLTTPSDACCHRNGAWHNC